MTEKSIAEIVPVTLSALMEFRKGAMKEVNHWNKLLKLCNERIAVAEKETRNQ